MADVRNYFKVRVLYYLSRSIQSDSFGEIIAWHTAAEIAHNTGVNYKSAYVLLPRWREAAWGYVDGMHMPAVLCDDGRPHWFYKINGKGMSYLARLHKWYEFYDEAKAAVDTIEDIWPGTDIKYVGWHVLGYNEYAKAVFPHSVVMFWPFRSTKDVHIYYWPIKDDNNGFLRHDIKAVVNLIRSVYGIEPGLEAVKQAQGYERYLKATALQHSPEVV